MKIINLKKAKEEEQEQCLSRLKQQDRIAQRELFVRMSGKMLAVCRNYIKDLHFAEDCMLKGFVKIFKNIESFKNKGSLEGWIRRIMVNECLDYLKQNKTWLYLEETIVYDAIDEQEEWSEFDVQMVLDQLPTPYRTVFNLFVLEDYSHKEIAKLLGISEEVSKTQLSRAQKKLKSLMVTSKINIHENIH